MSQMTWVKFLTLKTFWDEKQKFWLAGKIHVLADWAPPAAALNAHNFQRESTSAAAPRRNELIIYCIPANFVRTAELPAARRVPHRVMVAFYCSSLTFVTRVVLCELYFPWIPFLMFDSSVRQIYIEKKKIPWIFIGCDQYGIPLFTIIYRRDYCLIKNRITCIDYLIPRIDYLITCIDYLITYINYLIICIDCFITFIDCLIYRIDYLITCVDCFIKCNDYLIFSSITFSFLSIVSSKKNFRHRIALYDLSIFRL